MKNILRAIVEKFYRDINKNLCPQCARIQYKTIVFSNFLSVLKLFCLIICSILLTDGFSHTKCNGFRKVL